MTGKAKVPTRPKTGANGVKTVMVAKAVKAVNAVKTVDGISPGRRIKSNVSDNKLYFTTDEAYVGRAGNAANYTNATQQFRNIGYWSDNAQYKNAFDMCTAIISGGARLTMGDCNYIVDKMMQKYRYGGNESIHSYFVSFYKQNVLPNSAVIKVLNNMDSHQCDSIRSLSDAFVEKNGGVISVDILNSLNGRVQDELVFESSKTEDNYDDVDDTNDVNSIRSVNQRSTVYISYDPKTVYDKVRSATHIASGFVRQLREEGMKPSLGMAQTVLKTGSGNALKNLGVSNYYNEKFLLDACNSNPHRSDMIREILDNKVIAEERHVRKILDVDTHTKQAPYWCRRNSVDHQRWKNGENRYEKTNCVTMLIETGILVSYDLFLECIKHEVYILDYARYGIKLDSRYLLASAPTNRYDPFNAKDIEADMNVMEAVLLSGVGLPTVRETWNRVKKNCDKPSEKCMITACGTKENLPIVRFLVSQGGVVSLTCLEKMAQWVSGAKSTFIVNQYIDHAKKDGVRVAVDKDADGEDADGEDADNDGVKSEEQIETVSSSVEDADDADTIVVPHEFDDLPDGYDMYALIKLSPQKRKALGVTITKEMNLFDLTAYVLQKINGYFDGPNIVLPTDHAMCVDGRNIIDLGSIYKWIYTVVNRERAEAAVETVNAETANTVKATKAKLVLGPAAKSRNDTKVARARKRVNNKRSS